MDKDFTKEERLKCLESRIIRCVDVNDSESLRELLGSLESGEETLAVSGKPEVIDLAKQIDRSSLKKLMGIALIDAAVKNSPEIIQTLLDLGAPINYMDEFKHTPILRASEYGHTEVVRLLCRQGCDTNISDSWTRTPIHWAAHSRHTEVVRELLAHGALPDPVDKNYKFTPLMLAARMGKTEIVRMLLQRSKEIIPEPNCLLCSAPPGPAQFIIDSLEETAEDSHLTKSNKSSWSPDSERTLPSSDTKNESSTPELNTASAPIYTLLRSDRSSERKTFPVTRWNSLNKGNSHFVKSLETITLCDWHKVYPRSALLQRARDINHTDIHGENPIFDASRQGHWDIVDMLIDEGCNINHIAKFRGRQTAPILIARNSKNAVEMLVNLVKLNCNLELTGSSHFFGYWNLPAERITAFQLALMDGHVLATKILALGGATLIPPASDNWLSAFSEKEDQDWVLDLLFNPRSLKDACRIRIRKCLCVKPTDSMKALPLPEAIKLYLAIPELKQFEQYFVKPTFA